MLGLLANGDGSSVRNAFCIFSMHMSFNLLKCILPGTCVFAGGGGVMILGVLVSNNIDNCRNDDGGNSILCQY